jgi:hypothetical protein
MRKIIFTGALMFQLLIEYIAMGQIVPITADPISIDGITRTGKGAYLEEKIGANLVAPVLFIEPTDMENAYDAFAVKSRYNLPIISDLKAAGFDIIILTFDEYRTDYRVNAGVVEKMVRQIAAQNPAAKTTIIAPGPGGLMAHYAVKKMENASFDHKVERIISIDTPYQGWQYPLGAVWHLGRMSQTNLTHEVAKFKKLTEAFGGGGLSKLNNQLANIDAYQLFLSNAVTVSAEYFA